MNKIIIEETKKSVETSVENEAEALAKRIIGFYFDFSEEGVKVIIPYGNLFIDREEFPIFYEELKRQLDDEISRRL